MKKYLLLTGIIIVFHCVYSQCDPSKKMPRYTLIKFYDVRNKKTIEIQDLAKGTFVYSAILKNNQKLSGKIIIQ